MQRAAPPALEQIGRPAGVRMRSARVAMAALLCAWSAVHAAEIRVLCPSALRTPVLDIARSFSRSSGHRIEFVFASVGAVHKRVATGERADVAIGTVAGVDALLRLGRGVEASNTALVRAALGLAVRDRTARIAPTPAGVAAALQSAASIVVPDPTLGVPGGSQAAQLLERLGLEQELMPRIRRLNDAREIGKRVAAGAADIGIGAMSDLLQADGVAVVGPLLEPATEGTAYAALLIKGSENVEAARAFVAHLRSPEAAALFRKSGYLPPD